MNKKTEAEGKQNYINNINKQKSLINNIKKNTKSKAMYLNIKSNTINSDNKGNQKIKKNNIFTKNKKGAPPKKIISRNLILI